MSGSVAAAESRKLLIMAAGEQRPLAGAMPVLRGIADRVIEVGGPGAGAAMKLAVNSVLFAINQAIAESLVLAERAGIERSVAYEVFASSAAAAPIVHYRRPVFEHPESTPVTFPIDLAIKDLGLLLALGSDGRSTAAAGRDQPGRDAGRGRRRARGGGHGQHRRLPPRYPVGPAPYAVAR